MPEELSSKVGPEFKPSHTEDFLRLWHTRRCVSLVGFPQSHGSVEVAVKTAKRLLMSNTGPTGSLDHDHFLRAILKLHHTPDPDLSTQVGQVRGRSGVAGSR